MAAAVVLLIPFRRPNLFPLASPSLVCSLDSSDDEELLIMDNDTSEEPSRGCLGSCTRPAPIIAVDEPSQGLRIQGQMVKKPSVSDDFWSTSTCDMDNSAFQSQRSISSIGISNQSLNNCSGTGSTSNHSEFINHGLLLWNQMRLQWMENNRSENQEQVREPRLSCNASYESLLGTNKRFFRPIPLSEMVDFLVDIWEQEGLYD